MPRFEPQSNDVTEPFWEASRDKKYLIQWCTACDTSIYYPREVCPSCLSEDKLEWRTASGKGEVYTYNVMHKAGVPFMADRVPYVVALVMLEEGARILTNIVNCDPSAVKVGMPVQVAWEELTDGRNLAVFEPR